MAIDYKDALVQLRLTQIGAARFFHINERTSRRYAAGTPVPWLIEMIIRIMLHHNITVATVQKLMGLTPELDE